METKPKVGKYKPDQERIDSLLEANRKTLPAWHFQTSWIAEQMMQDAEPRRIQRELFTENGGSS